MAAFEYALAAGCDGFEFDVRHTRDGQNALWHDPEWQGLAIDSTDSAVLADKDGMRPASLEGVLREFSHRAYLDIELKVPGNEASVLAALRENPPQRGFLVSSFYPEILTGLRALDPALPLGFIFDRQKAMAIWREMPVQVLLPERELVNPVLIDEAHYRGLQIMTWTVNHRDDMVRFADLLIDGLISDDPQLLYQTFQSR